MITKNFIKQCEKAEEIQKAWKKKNTHIMDNVYVKHTEENILILKEIEFNNDKDEGGEDREYVIFERAGVTVEPIPFTTFNKEAFYQYDDGELNVIYLPTQEQLWDMLEGNVLEKLDHFMANLSITIYETLQEHLINHVMEQNWGKVWTGEKWVKIE